MAKRPIPVGSDCFVDDPSHRFHICEGVVAKVNGPRYTVRFPDGKGGYHEATLHRDQLVKGKLGNV